MKTDNLLWIDILKGIGIISVVLGHIYGTYLSKLIFVYHMPLFFFISGRLATPTRDYRTFYIKKLRSLLLPYLVYFLILSLLFYEFPGSIKEWAIFLGKGIIGGRLLVRELGVFWFITCLFLTQQLMNYLLLNLGIRKTGYAMIVFLGLSYLNSQFYSNIWLPWNANVVFFSAPFYYYGYLHKKGRVRGFSMNRIKSLITIVLVCGLVYNFPGLSLNMKSSYYGMPMFSLLASVALIEVLISISLGLSEFNASSLVSSLGKESLVIMYLHQPMQYTLESQGLSNNLVRAILAILLSYCIAKIVYQNRITRTLFLGRK